MPRIITPDSEEGKELLRWEQFPSNWNGEHFPAGNPYVYREYPRMLYKAVRRSSGQVTCLEPTPSPYHYTTQAEYDRAIMLNEQQNRACTVTVTSAREYEAKRAEGWRDTPKDALEHYETLQQEMATAAAEAAHAVQRMSARAKDEHKTATDATDAQVVDVPAPKQKPKPPAKPKPPPKPVKGAPDAE